MEVMEAIKRRESYRSFKEEPISDEELKKLLYAAERAPRIGSVEIIVLQDKEKIAALSDATKEAMIASGGWNRMRASTPDYNPLYKAPTVIMFVGYSSEPFISETVGLAAGMMVMAATDMGLGSITVSSIRRGFNGPKGSELKKSMEMGQNKDLILAVCVGYKDKSHYLEFKGASHNIVKYVR